MLSFFRCLVKNTSAVVEIEMERPMCLELYTEFKDLGRFMLRSGGHTIAAGLVEEVSPICSPFLVFNYLNFFGIVQKTKICINKM